MNRRSFAPSRPADRGTKLVQSAGVTPNAKWTPKFELFDVTADPFEEKDLSADKPEEVAKLKRIRDVVRGRDEEGLRAPRIIIGSEKENPVRLSRQDCAARKPDGRRIASGTGK